MKKVFLIFKTFARSVAKRNKSQEKNYFSYFFIFKFAKFAAKRSKSEEGKFFLTICKNCCNKK